MYSNHTNLARAPQQQGQDVIQSYPSPQSLISICIPARNRPSMLCQALDSCLRQSYSNIEIVIGDDSEDDASERAVRPYVNRNPDKIHYQRNRQRLWQNANVNNLFDRAAGDRLILLHDDDLLEVPDAVAKLASCWNNMPNLSAAFGKQYVMDGDGNVSSVWSEELNTGSFRVAENSGAQTIAAAAGILQMFPNNGYMVMTDLARKIRYRSRSEVGDACDFDFGVRFCIAANSVWFLNEYISKWRVWELQLSKAGSVAHYVYESLQMAAVPAEAMKEKEMKLERFAPKIVSGYARRGEPGKALAIYLSSHYTMRNRLRLRGFYHALVIAKSFLRKMSRRPASLRRF